MAINFGTDSLPLPQGTFNNLPFFCYQMELLIRNRSSSKLFQKGEKVEYEKICLLIVAYYSLERIIPSFIGLALIDLRR